MRKVLLVIALMFLSFQSEFAVEYVTVSNFVNEWYEF
jgi:hypothetical protein